MFHALSSMLTVGEILKKEREKQELSLLDVEKKIKVRRKFLEAIEKNDWAAFTSKIYISGVIRNYAKSLGLNQEHVQAFFRREYAKKEDVTFKRRVSKGLLTPETRKVVYSSIGVVFLLFAAYFGFQVLSFLSPPRVEILLPKEQVFKREDKIQIVGKTEKEATVMVFGNRIFQDKDGKFLYDLPLKPGKNALVVEVVGANGKKTVIKKEYLLDL